jgi:hypothetical protein
VKKRIASAFLWIAMSALSARAQSTSRDELIPILRGALRTFQGCFQDEGEGPRDATTCVAGNSCTRSSRDRALRSLRATADLGLAGGFENRMRAALINDCFRCDEHGKWHTKQGHCTIKCGGNNSFSRGFDVGRLGVGPCYEGCKGGHDLEALVKQIIDSIKTALGLNPPPEPPSALGGATVATNRITVDNPADESCTPPVAALATGARSSPPPDFLLPPSALLDWTPTTSPPFRITLIESLKALVVGAAPVLAGVVNAVLSAVAPAVAAFTDFLTVIASGALGGAPVPPGVGAAVSAVAGAAGGVAGVAVVGGAGAIAAAGIPSALLGLPPGPSPTPSSFNRPVASNLGANEGRLRADLRRAAHTANPAATLALAAERFARGDTLNGNAFADLSVTGRRSFAAFRRRPPTATAIADIARLVSASARSLARDALLRGAQTALDRAIAVAKILRVGGWPTSCPERQTFGWIAVSGEDDQPHRPVNVASAPFPQFDLTVPVPLRARPGAAPLNVSTRFFIAHRTPPPGSGTGTCAAALSNNMPPGADPAPVVPRDAEVILYVHGMDSRAEEALDLTAALHAIGNTTGKNWTVISVDLPTSGYADNLDPEQVAPLDHVGESKFHYNGAADLELTDLKIFDTRGVHRAPVVDFIEDFIVAFVDRLERVTPVKARIRAVVGGSLGGNMSLRLGRRNDVDWIRRVVPWSPAAIWPSYADGSNPADHIGVAMPFMWAGGDPRLRTESPVARRQFFFTAFDWTAGLLNFKPQPREWYRDGWACKAQLIMAARLERQETYNRNFRLWHWRLATEQIVFSHRGPGADGRPLFLANRKPMLLMCGYMDTGGKLCEHTRRVAPQMVNTPGRAIFFRGTGHSIHNERPCLLARHIVDFLGERSADCTKR